MAHTYGKGEKTPIVSPEKIELNTFYSFTLSPNDSCQYFGYAHRCEKRDHIFDPTETQRLKLFQRYIRDYPYKVLKKFCDVKLYSEISRNGRLHCHGWIKFKDFKSVMLFYTNVVEEYKRVYGFIEIDTIKDMQVWKTYCTKQQHLWEACDVEQEITPPKVGTKKQISKGYFAYEYDEESDS
jgi:hypothetical protein